MKTRAEVHEAIAKVKAMNATARHKGYHCIVTLNEWEELLWELEGKGYVILYPPTFMPFSSYKKAVMNYKQEKKEHLDIALQYLKKSILQELWSCLELITA